MRFAKQAWNISCRCVDHCSGKLAITDIERRMATIIRIGITNILRGDMSIQQAKQQFHNAWEQYEKGVHGQMLWDNLRNYARVNHLPQSYQNPLHGLKQLAKSGSLDVTDATKAFLLACELAALTKGLTHHVVLLTGQNAGLLSAADVTATEATVMTARQRLTPGIK